MGDTTFVSVNDVAFAVEIDAGPNVSPNAPVVMLSHSLAASRRMWDAQIPVLAQQYRVVSYDIRGHGQTEAPSANHPRGGAYTMDSLAQDALGLMDALELDKVNFVGLSIGGMTAMGLGILAPHRVNSLVMANTKAGSAPGYGQQRDERIETVAEHGMVPLVDGTIGRWFTESFAQAHADKVAPVRAMVAATPPDGFIGCCHALNGLNYRDPIANIKTPTLVIAGQLDESTTLDDAQFIHNQIGGSQLVVLAGCKHLSNIEGAVNFNAALLEFLARNNK